MKRVVSISLGSSTRNHKVETEFLGQKVSVERIGTDGDLSKAINLIKELDGKVDAFGLGGIDLYLYAGNRRYILRDAKKIVDAARLTPIVDGSGLKNTLERKVIKYLHQHGLLDFENSKVLMVCAADRFGMAETLSSIGTKIIYGDLIFALGLPIPLYSLDAVARVARIVGPIISRIPFKFLYPTGEKQEELEPKFAQYYLDADIIAGDFHFIRRHMPQRLEGKTIITNTITPQDLELLKQRGVRKLITTTPELQGRSFGTNVMEGIIVALSGQSGLSPQQYEELLDAMKFEPRVVELPTEQII
ncbi:MAG: quinate 5-dehydrogenase [Clostridia bacterium]|nr:quinate 5-dehydrogenase [Clostridia bacterium]